MKTTRNGQPEQGGASLVELMGVVCIFGLIISVVIPVINDLLDNARLIATLRSVNAVQDATRTYFQQYGKFGLKGGAAITWTNEAHDYWDREVLIKEQLIEQVVRSRLATNCYVRLVQVESDATADVIFDYCNKGHLGSMYCNNGVYDLTQEYSARRRHHGLFYARAETDQSLRCSATSSGTGRTAPGPWAMLPGLVGRGGFAPVDLGGTISKTLPRAWDLGSAVAQKLERLFGAGVAPLRACYPTTTPAPPPSVGGGGVTPVHDSGDRPPAHNDAHDGSVVVEVVLEGIRLHDAYRLSKVIDGNGQSNWAYWDSVGRVKYDFVSSFTGTAFIYLAHR